MLPEVHESDAVQYQLQQMAIADESMLLNNTQDVSAMSRVLILYTGGTIGMKNTSTHGYIPVAGYLTESLSLMNRFHDPNGSFHRNVPPCNTSVAPMQFNDVNIALSGSYAIKNDTNVGTDGAPNTSINGTPFRRTKLPALITPPSLYGKRIRYSILEYDPLLDSSDMTMTDWVKIAVDIELNYQLYDAFIILHGTDTMAYTSSALSFMLQDLGKTVIMTGSQVPLSELRNDAVDNLLGALTIAGHFVIPEVGLFFNNKLLRGNRSTKVDAVDFNAFDSPNLPPLVNVAINIDVSWQRILRPRSISKFKAWKTLNPNVATLRLFPGITESTVRAFLAPPIQGVVLETFGAGNFAHNRPEILSLFKEASDRGVVLINVTQCQRGFVSDAYATGRALLNCGVQPGGDMTPECALTKLSYLLGHKKYSPADIARLMRKNLRGELTIPPHTPQFSFTPYTSGVVANVLYMLGVTNENIESPAVGTDSQYLESTSSNTPNEGEFDASIASGTMRRRRSFPTIGDSIDDDEIMALEKMIVPMTLCQSAKIGDVAGINAMLTHYAPLVNMSNYDGRTPLHVACSEGNLETVETLLLRGAMVHLRDRHGHTPLWDAVHGKHLDVTKLLRRCGAHFCVEEEKPAIDLACSFARNGDEVGLQGLFAAGFDMNKCDDLGRTPLHYAACMGHKHVVSYLVSLVNVEPLHQYPDTASSSVESIISNPELDSLNANDAPNDERKERKRTTSVSSTVAIRPSVFLTKDKWGRTAKDDAALFGYQDIVEILDSFNESM